MTEEKLKPTDLLQLYSFFENNGSQDKTLMIAIISPLLTIFTGVLGYLTNSLIEKRSVLNDAQLLGYATSSFAGLVISWFLAYVVKEFLVHAEENYRKANSIGENLDNLIEQKDFKFYKSQYGDEKSLFPVQDKSGFYIIRSRKNWMKIGDVFIVFYIFSKAPPILFLCLMVFFLAPHKLVPCLTCATPDRIGVPGVNHGDCANGGPARRDN